MIEQDSLRRFLFDGLGVRGEWVKLTTSWQAAKQHQCGSDVLQQLLGQALVAVVMLSATVKFKGSMILQAQGSGDINTLVAQATDQRNIRAFIRGNENVVPGTLEAMFGQGRLVLTVETGNGQPYQGVVPLKGNDLAAALQSYFEQSEQLKTRMWLFANERHAVGLMLQELPSQALHESDWQHVEILADTVTEQELIDLDCETLLHRLFHQEKVRLFDIEPVEFKCACSRERIEKTLFTMGRTELQDILKEQDAIEVNCEFCGEHYHFSTTDVEKILFQYSEINGSETRH